MVASSTNLNFSKQLLFATIAGSSLVAVANYDIVFNTLPSLTAQYTQVNIGYPWEEKLGSNINSDSELNQYETILLFAQKVISDSKDIDVEIQSTVNKIFWDLI
jgi:hypothetical protein